MRNSFIRLLAAAALALPLALAPSLASADQAKSKPTATKSKKKTIDFRKGDDVGGTVATGDGTQIEAAKPVVHSNLIRVRTHFRDKILRDGDRI
jgi:hypothetical protein